MSDDDTSDREDSRTGRSRPKKSRKQDPRDIVALLRDRYSCPSHVMCHDSHRIRWTSNEALEWAKNIVSVYLLYPYS
jgi:hypothetical protein